MTAATVTASRPPVAALYDLISGAWISRMVSLLAELGVADAMPHNAAVTISELAAATSTDPDALNRVMRALAAKGVLGYDGDTDSYSHTEVSRLLRSDHPISARGLALIAGAPWQWRAWTSLSEAVRTGASQFSAANGRPLWDYFAEEDPDAGNVFQQAMSDLSRRTDQPVAAAIDVGDARTVVDVGGGHGNLLVALAARHPQIATVLFESPATLRSLASDPRAAERAAGISLVAGDLTDTVDVPADLYLLKQVIHLLDDDTAVRVLRNCAAKARPGARVVVVDRLVTDGPAAVQAKISDVQMLVLHAQGRERTEAEFTALFARAGMRLTRLTPTMPGLHLLEAEMI